MSISYTCFSKLTIPQTDTRIAYLRRTHPEWYGGIFHLTNAERGRFDAEIERELGIVAQCRFALHLLNSDFSEESWPAVEFVYEVFGTDFVTIAYGMDSIRPPERGPYLPMKIA